MLRVAEQAAVTDTGRRRQANEDAMHARAPVFVIADGMGGAQAGEVAAAAVIDAFGQGLPDVPAERALAQVITRANAHIHALSRADSRRAGMGTTVVAAHVGANDVALAHVGDSRIYRWREDTLQRLTADHSLVEELIRDGRLTPEEAEHHPQRSVITRALGPDPDIDVETASWRGQDGDVFLLCSDGLTSMIGDADVADVLRQSAASTPGQLTAAARALVAAANGAGGRDNITVVLFRLADVAAAADTHEGEHTLVGETALRVSDVEAAAREDAAARDAAQRRRLAPAAAGTGAPASTELRGRRRWLVAIGVALFVSLPFVIGGWAASQTVYFVGSKDGFVAMFRGMPIDLPLGLDLYSVTYTTGVPVQSVPQARRETLLDQTMRSRKDAADLIRTLERGELTQR